MNKGWLAAGVALILASCQKDNDFHVNGSLEGGAGKMVYLIHEGVDGASVVDSSKVGANGKFSLAAGRPAFTDFYSLRIDSLSLWLSVDSTETISVQAKSGESDYAVSGSENSVLLHDWLMRLNAMSDSMATLASDTVLSRMNRDVAAFNLVTAYKDTVCSFVQKNSASPVAYYLLFKKLPNGLTPFSIYANEDFHYFALVGNAMKKKAENAPRTQQLLSLIGDVQSMRRNAQLHLEDRPQVGSLELSLPDQNGKEVKLSSLKGKNVLLEFCYLAQFDADVLKTLALIRDKFAAKGFEIYMVNFDRNAERWKKSVAALPWITVLDEKEGSALTYNIQNLPTNFFIDKNGDIIGKDVTLLEMANYLSSQR
ncbi:MAG: AhpC/TSA family protein [Bacteroidales bacterium]|nr:AhpC/TSA family protein [Candidatus Physcocola equi]